MTEILSAVSPSVFSWSMLSRRSSAAYLLPRPEKGAWWPTPCRTHPVRVAAVVLKLTDLVSISRNATTKRATWKIIRAFGKRDFTHQHDFSEKQSRVNVMHQSFVTGVTPDNLHVTHDISSTTATFSRLVALRLFQCCQPCVFPANMGLFFSELAFFLVTCGLLIFGLVLFKNCLFLRLFFANFLVNGLLFWNCCVTFAVLISWKSIVYCLARSSATGAAFKYSLAFGVQMPWTCSRTMGWTKTAHWFMQSIRQMLWCWNLV